jgi:hypothetical protein
VFSISVLIPERPWIPPDHEDVKKKASETDRTLSAEASRSCLTKCRVGAERVTRAMMRVAGVRLTSGDPLLEAALH